jgi:hypothetical protein
VFDARDDEVAAPGRLERVERAPHGGVVAVGAAPGEDDLGRLGAEQGRDRRPRAVEHGLGLLAEVVDARCIAPGIFRHTTEAIESGRYKGRRGVVIQVDARHDPMIVANALTLSNKRTRHLFRATPILAGLRSGAHLPGESRRAARA